VRGNPKNNKNSTPSSSIPTGGEVFEDGTMVELVEDLRQTDGLGLFMSDGRKRIVSRRVEHKGQAYVPLVLHPSVRRALWLPSGVCPYDSTAKLFEELVAVAAKFIDLDRHFLELLVVFVLASWLADLLPVPINLLLWCPLVAHGAQVLLWLRCLCRIALALTGVDAADLKALPDGLPATLLILHPGSSRRTLELLAASGWRGFYAPRSGRLVEFLGAKALATDALLDDRTLDPLIVIPVAANRRPLPVLDRRAQEQVAKEFQPKLLQYRMQHRKTGDAAASAQAGSAGTASPLATGMRICFSDAPELMERQVALLAEAERGIDETRRADPRLPVIEVMWGRCHDPGRERLYIGEIAMDVNELLPLPGDRKLTYRMVGSVVRSLGLDARKLDRRGYGLRLDPSTRRRIHQLARLHDVPSVGQPFPGCAECSQAQPPGIKELAK
jgi:hypothetical protein